MLASETHRELMLAAQAYFDAFYTSDIEQMRAVFHPGARLFSYEAGVLQDEGLADYLKRVAARPSPASLGQPRHDAILLVDQAGPGLAMIKSQAARLPRVYTDYITLLKIDGHWRVMSKTFTWTEHADC